MHNNDPSIMAQPVIITVMVETADEKDATRIKTTEYKVWRLGDMVGLNECKTTIKCGLIVDDEGEHKEGENETDDDGNSPFTRATNELYSKFPQLDGFTDKMYMLDAIIRLSSTIRVPLSLTLNKDREVHVTGHPEKSFVMPSTGSELAFTDFGAELKTILQ